MGTVIDMTVNPSVHKTLHSILKNISTTKYLCSCTVCDVKLLSKTTPNYNHCVVIRTISKTNGCARTQTEGLLIQLTVTGNSNFDKARDCATKIVT
jgi:hypothetical protein